MPATRDKSQRPVFVYSNLHQLYKKGVQAAAAAPSPARATGISRGAVLKTGDLRAQGMKIESYRPRKLLRAAVPAPRAQAQALQSLRDNLRNLTELQHRLRFMLKELEELVKD